MILPWLKNWWLFVVHGILAIIFGIAALASPGMTVYVLLIFFGMYLLIDGLVALLTAFKGERWGWYLISGLASLALGVMTLARPGATAVALLILIGTWAILKGVAEIIAALQLRKEIQGEFWLILSGLLSVAFGLYCVFRPGVGALAIISLIALFAILKGIILILLGFKLKGVQGKVRGAIGEALR